MKNWQIGGCTVFNIRFIKIISIDIQVALYGTGLSSENCKKRSESKFLYGVQKFISVIFASFIFLVEEVQNVIRSFKESKIIVSLAEKQGTFKYLSHDEKDEVKNFYNAKIRQLDKAQKLICREATIQVVLQLTLMLYQENFHNPKRFSKA